jgi:hypothetical protein
MWWYEFNNAAKWLVLKVAAILNGVDAVWQHENNTG